MKKYNIAILSIDFDRENDLPMREEYKDWKEPILAHSPKEARRIVANLLVSKSYWPVSQEGDTLYYVDSRGYVDSVVIISILGEE